MRSNKYFRSNKFGSTNKYPCLIGLEDNMEQYLNEKEHEYISSFIADFNVVCKELLKLKDVKIFNYLVDAVRNDYKLKLDEIDFKYVEEVSSFLRNFVYAKLKNIKYGN